ncbi:hypothetical protein ACHQM5_019577 [Ranunculus cassubicifolius]
MRGAKQLSSFFRSSLKYSSQSPLLKTLDKSTSVQINSIPKSKSKSIESPAVSLSSSLREFQKQQQAIRESEKEGLTDEWEKEIFHKISGILTGGAKEVVASICLPASDIPSDEDEELEEKNVNMPWFSNTPNSPMSDHHNVKSRGRKEKYVFRHTQRHRFKKLVNACGEKLGADATLAVFGKLQREIGRKEYKALINQCVEKARNSQDEDESLDNIHKAYRLLKAMREQGFQVEDEIFGILKNIDMTQSPPDFCVTNSTAPFY